MLLSLQATQHRQLHAPLSTAALGNVLTNALTTARLYVQAAGVTLPVQHYCDVVVQLLQPNV